MGPPPYTGIANETIIGIATSRDGKAVWMVAVMLYRRHHPHHHIQIL
jgi:hypothetical protein